MRQLSWMQPGRAAVAGRTPLHLRTGCGARQRRSRIGGAAKGMDRHWRVDAPTRPQPSLPSGASTSTSICAAATASWTEVAHSSPVGAIISQCDLLPALLIRPCRGRIEFEANSSEERISS